jgi:hypothetical protein
LVHCRDHAVIFLRSASVIRNRHMRTPTTLGAIAGRSFGAVKRTLTADGVGSNPARIAPIAGDRVPKWRYRAKSRHTVAEMGRPRSARICIGQTSGTESVDASSIDKARSHWKRLLFAWSWPFLLLSTNFLPGDSKYPRLIFFFIFFPAFLACNYIASKPVRDRQMTIAQGIWWIGVMPILIWAAVIFGTFGLARLTSAD